MTTLHVTCIDDENAAEALRPEWEELENHVVPWVPFCSATWNLLWWKHFRQARAVMCDDLRLFVVRDEEGRMVAVAPMLLTSRPGRYLKVAREIQFFGSDPNMTEVRGPVCRSEDRTRVIEAVGQALHQRSADWDRIRWAGVVPGQNDRPILEDAGNVQWGEATELFFLTLPDSWGRFRAGLRRNIKESLRKCYNSLAREGHRFAFRAVSDPAETPAALDRFLELHAERAMNRDAVVHGNVFAGELARAFLHAYGREMAAQGRLRVFQLEIGGAVVATRIGFLHADQLYLYYSGYSREWRRYSVMTTVVSESLRWAIEHGVRIAVLSTGRDVSKTRWGAESISYDNGIQSTRDWRGKWCFGLFDLMQAQSNSNTHVGWLLQRVRRAA